MRTKIQVLSTDTVAQWIEHRRDNPRTWVQILASVIFFICSVAFLLSLLPWRRDKWSNIDWGLQKLSNVDSNNDIQIRKIIMLKIESNVYIYRKKAVNNNISIKGTHEVKRASEYVEDLKSL